MNSPGFANRSGPGPPGASLPPGAKFDPLMGTATGRFAPFVWLGDTLMLMTREAFEHMQAQGVRGLLGCKAMLRFRQQSPLLDAASLCPRAWTCSAWATSPR
nr:double-CXXCG motif protein [Corallococcus exiguus]